MKNEERFVRAVVAYWRAAREKAGILKFTDDAPIKNLKDTARRLYAEGMHIEDVRKGIVEHADDPHANRAARGRSRRAHRVVTTRCDSDRGGPR